MRNTIIAIVAGIAFVGGGFVAGTFASGEPAAAQAVEEQVTESPTAEQRVPRLRVLQAAARELGLEPAELVRALRDGAIPADLTDDVDGLVSTVVDAIGVELQQAVEDGRLDAERAGAITASLNERVTEFINSPHENFGKRWLPDRHVRGFLREAAEVIGIDVRALAAGLASGNSIADVAEENGVSRGNLVAQLTNAARDRIETAVDRTRD